MECVARQLLASCTTGSRYNTWTHKVGHCQHFAQEAFQGFEKIINRYRPLPPERFVFTKAYLVDGYDYDQNSFLFTNEKDVQTFQEKNSIYGMET